MIMTNSKKTVVLFFCFLVLLLKLNTVDAQKNEYGFGIGAVTMTGDLIPTYNILANRPAALFFYKRNYTYGSSIRLQLSVNQIYGSDAEHGNDIFAQNRDKSINTLLTDFALFYEYNFLDFRNPKKRVIVSPYFIAGVGVAILNPPADKVNDYSVAQPIFPFGAGIKYRFKRKWILSLEFVVKPMITDYLDNITGDDQKVKNYNTGGKNTNDTYYFIGFKVSRPFWKIHCPFDAY